MMTGKTYAISDIHGMYGSYMEAVKSLKENDTLFVLGDVIDRGRNGIKILQDMMKRKNVKFILGNHEWQMIQVLGLIRKYNLSKEEIELYCDAGWAAYFERENEKYYLKDHDKDSKKSAEKFKKQKQEILSQLSREKLSNNDDALNYDIRLMYIWRLCNHGEATLDDYLMLNKQEQDDIYKYLTGAYVFAKKQINNKNVVMVHASPPELEDFVESSNSEYDEGVKFDSWFKRYGSKLTYSLLALSTEQRDYTNGFEFWKKYGYKTIYGHTPTGGKISIDRKNDAVCIDIGCPFGSGLALYCLDDESVKYIPTKENYIDEKEESGKNLDEEVSEVEIISDRDYDTEYSEEEKLNLLFDNQEKYTTEYIKNEIIRLSGSYMVEGYRTFKNLFSEEEKQEIEEEILEFIEDNNDIIESEKIKEIILSLSNNGIERGYERFGKYLEVKDMEEVQKRIEEIKGKIKEKITGKNGIFQGLIQLFENWISNNR